MKRSSFRSVEFTLERGSGYGQYVIRSNYKGVSIKVCTTDSEAWDWLDDTSDEKKHDYARRHCYHKIVEAYERE